MTQLGPTVLRALDRGRLLIVEDDDSLARILSFWLTSEGYDVTVAHDGGEGLRCAGEGGWDVVLADVRLPGASGLDILAESKRLHPRIPAILMTAERDPEWLTRAVDQGVDGFLTKPLSCPDVVQRVNRMVQRTKSDQQVVLAVGAHPDDVEIGCGGALMAHRAAGHRVVVLTLSDGAAGGAPSRRVEEAQRAAARLQAELELGHLPDTAISPSGPAIGIIERAVLRYRPHVVYTHTQHDVHQDHRAVHEATRVAARAVHNVFCYQSPSSTIEFHPRHFVNIGPYIEDKLDLLACYRSQTTKCAYLDPALIRATACYWGRYAGYGLVEPLEVLRASVN